MFTVNNLAYTNPEHVNALLNDLTLVKNDDEMEYVLRALTDSTIVDIYNYYISEMVNDPDSQFFNMDDIDELLYGKSPWEILNMVSSYFNTNDDYFSFDGYGNLRSYSLREAYHIAFNYLLEDMDIDGYISALESVLN